MYEVKRLAALIRQRNETETLISEITGRPASIGHLGEFIAAKVFHIRLAPGANHKGLDGWFSEGSLRGMSVNVKWYGKHEGILDMCSEGAPDYYLVFCGPRSAAAKAVGPRPWLIDYVFLFEEAALRESLTTKIGIATSVKSRLWEQNEVYPRSANATMSLSEEQVAQIKLFGSQAR